MTHLNPKPSTYGFSPDENYYLWSLDVTCPRYCSSMTHIVSRGHSSAWEAPPLWTKVKLKNEHDIAIPSFPTGLLYVDCEQAPAQKVFVNSGWDTPLSQLIRLSHSYVVIRKRLGFFIFKRRRLSSVSDWFMWNPMEASLSSNKNIYCDKHLTLLIFLTTNPYNRHIG